MGDYFYYKTEQGGKFQSALLQASNYPADPREAGKFWFNGYQNGRDFRVPSEGEPHKTFSFSSYIIPTMFGNNPDQVDTTYSALWELGCELDFSSIVPNDKDNYYLIASVKFDNCIWAVYGCDLYNTINSRIGIMYGFLITEKAPSKIANKENTIRTTIYGTQSSWTITDTKYRLLYLSLYAGDNLSKTYGSIYIMSKSKQTNPRISEYNGGIASSGFFLDTEMIEQYGKFSDTEEGNTDYGDYSGSGGYGGGSFDDSSDAFGLPSLPSLGVSEVGFINVYNPTKGQLQGFADELFPNFEMPAPSTKEGLEAISENIANTFTVLGDFAESYVNAGLVNYVIDCHIVPVAPVTNGTSSIKVGFKTFNYSPAKVTSDYVSFDCGTLEIAEYYQNFLDYEGTKAKLYLPFIGFVDIKPEWFQSGRLGVTYHFNIIDGSCIAFVIATSSKSKLKNTVVATFGGNCCVHMPITGVNYSSMISGIVGGAVGIASNASNMIKTNRADKGSVMSNIEGATGIASNLADAVGAKPSIEQSNGYNAGMSFMCYRRPYLLIERPVASFSKDYPREQGLPLNVTKRLGSMKGFTTCTAPVVDNFNCLEEEKEMIKQALIEGTIF